MAVAGYNVVIDGSLRLSVLTSDAHITSLTPGVHTARVQAFDDSGNLSALTGAVSFTVPTPETAGDTFPGIAISGAQGELAIDTTGASVQTGEPWDDARTVWLTLTGAAGRVTFDTLLDQLRDLYAGAVLAIPNLQGYWRLNEGGYVAVDDSGLQRHGVYVGGHTETDGGLEGGSFGAAFDGVGQYAELPDSAGLSIGATGLTVALLVRVDQPAVLRDESGLAIVVRKPGEWSVDFASTASLTPGSFQAAAGGAVASFADTDYLAGPEWVMLIAAFDPPGSVGGVTLYRSNAPRSFRPYLTTPTRPGSPQPLLVAGQLSGAGMLAGAVSDVAAWDRLLTGSEIDALYTEFAGVQNPVPFNGVIAQGKATTSGADLVLAFTHAAAVGDTLLLIIGSEYNPGGNTIFDSTLGNDYHRVVKSHQDPAKLGKAIVYRCDLAQALVAGDTLTIRPDNPIGVRDVIVAHFAPLGVLDSSVLLTGVGTTPPAAPAAHPTNRDDRVLSVLLTLGPPGDTFNEDPDWTTQLRIGTLSFDAGVPVTRLRLVAQDAQTNLVAGFPAGVVLTNVGTAIPAGSTLHLHVAHSFVGGGSQGISSPGTTWSVVGSDVDPGGAYRQTWYRGVLTADLPTGGQVTMAGSSGILDYAAILSAWQGDDVPQQTNTSKGNGQNFTTAPVDPGSLAGVAVASVSWAGPTSDVVNMPDDWLELARVGTPRLSILTARPVAQITHQTTFSPDDDTTSRAWVVTTGYLPPLAPTGGPLTPHETNVSLSLSLLGVIPFGADTPYQPTVDPTPDPPRKWISIVLSYKRP